MRATAADWELLNAYVDGELKPDPAAALESRLRDDPELRRALNRIRSVKRELARLRPPEGLPDGVSDRSWRPFAVRIAAVAAGLVIAVGIATGVFVWQSGTPGWLEQAEALHNQLSQKAYVVEERHAVQLVSGGAALEFRPPDLTESRLYLVDVATARQADRETIALHYRGMRGCRLTVVAIEAGDDDSAILPDSEPANGTLMAAWLYRGFRFAVIAHGMDPERFRSVADYARAEIADSARDADELRIAMADGYRDAQPCV